MFREPSKGSGKGRGGFPDTDTPWIESELRRGDEGRLTVLQHLMAVYATPLERAFARSDYRGAGEPGDVVNGFFAHRVANPDYLARWRESELRLHQWLLNGLLFWARDLLKRRGREPDSLETVPREALPAVAELPADEYARAFAAAVVGRALQLAEETCRQQGFETHWHLFIRHFRDGVPYKDLVAETRIPAHRANGMARTAAKRLRAAIREILQRDGCRPETLEDEVRHLIEAMRR